MRARWVPVGGSVRGSSHEASGRPNEDAWAATAAGPVAVAAVADGHGSDRSPRSGTGARFAADVAIEVVAPLADGVQDARELERVLRRTAAPAIVERWHALVDADVAAHPFTDDELAAIGGAVDRASARLAYGTTLQVVCGTDAAMGMLGIGDGDVLAVCDDGETVLRPLPDDPENVGHFTSSLAQSRAVESVRVAAVDLGSQPLRLAWASTDGFGGAFVDREWWHEVGRDLSQRAARMTSDELAERLPEWLAEPASVAGDDTTMVVLLRDAPPAVRDEPEPAPVARRTGRRPLLFGVLAAALVLVAAVPVWAFVRDDGSPSTFVLAGGGVAVTVDVERSTAVATKGAAEPADPKVAVERTATVWTARGTKLLRAGPHGLVTVDTGAAIAAIAVRHGSLWALTADGTVVFRLGLDDPCLTKGGCRPARIAVTH